MSEHAKGHDGTAGREEQEVFPPDSIALLPTYDGVLDDEQRQRLEALQEARKVLEKQGASVVTRSSSLDFTATDLMAVADYIVAGLESGDEDADPWEDSDVDPMGEEDSDDDVRDEVDDELFNSDDPGPISWNYDDSRLDYFPPHIDIMAGDGGTLRYTPERPVDVAELRNLVGEAIGAGSSCWSNLNGAGVFQSNRALEISQDLINDILTLFGREL